MAKNEYGLESTYRLSILGAMKSIATGGFTKLSNSNISRLREQATQECINVALISALVATMVLDFMWTVSEAFEDLPFGLETEMMRTVCAMLATLGLILLVMSIVGSTFMLLCINEAGGMIETWNFVNRAGWTMAIPWMQFLLGVSFFFMGVIIYIVFTFACPSAHDPAACCLPLSPSAQLTGVNRAQVLVPHLHLLRQHHAGVRLRPLADQLDLVYPCHPRFQECDNARAGRPKAGTEGVLHRQAPYF